MSNLQKAVLTLFIVGTIWNGYTYSLYMEKGYYPTPFIGVPNFMVREVVILLVAGALLLMLRKARA